MEQHQGGHNACRPAIHHLKAHSDIKNHQQHREGHRQAALLEELLADGGVHIGHRGNRHTGAGEGGLKSVGGLLLHLCADALVLGQGEGDALGAGDDVLPLLDGGFAPHRVLKGPLEPVHVHIPLVGVGDNGTALKLDIQLHSGDKGGHQSDGHQGGGDGEENLLPAHKVVALFLLGGSFGFLPAAAVEPGIPEAAQAGNALQHRLGGVDAHNHVGYHAHQQGVAEGIDGPGGGLAEEEENLRKNAVGGAEGAHQDYRHNDVGDVTVQNCGEGAVKAQPHRAVDGLAGADFLPDALGGDDVGIHTHTDTEDNTCNTRQGEGEGGDIRQQPGHRRHHNHHLPGEGKEPHKAGEAVLQHHVKGHQHKGNHPRLDHHILGSLAQGGRNGAIVPRIQSEGQGAALNLLGQRLGLLRSEAAANHSLAAGDDIIHRRVGNEGIIHPDGNNLPLVLPGSFRKFGGSLRAELKGNHILIGAGGGVRIHIANRADKVSALQNHLSGRLSFCVNLQTLPEGEHGRVPQLLDGLFRVIFGLPCLPRETDNNTVLGGIGVDLVIGDALGHQAGANHLGGRVHLLLGGVIAIRRDEGGVHTTPNINAPAYLRRTLDIGGGSIPAGDMDPKEGEVCRCQYHNGDSKKGP